MGKVGDTRAGVHGNVLLRRLDAFRGDFHLAIDVKRVW